MEGGAQPITRVFRRVWYAAHPMRLRTSMAYCLAMLWVHAHAAPALAQHAAAEEATPEANDSAASGSPSSSDIAEARALFIAGLAAVESGRWADAIESLERAYSLSRVPAALYNLAFALRALGRNREARDAFDRLLVEHANIDDEMRQNAERYRTEVAARVATIALVDLRADRRYEVRVDGARVPDRGRRPMTVEVDSGDRVVFVELAGHRPFTWEGPLADGQREAVRVAMRPLPTASDDSTIFESGWFWLVTSVVVVGGAAVGAYYYDQSRLLDPMSPNQVTLNP